MSGILRNEERRIAIFQNVQRIYAVVHTVIYTSSDTRKLQDKESGEWEWGVRIHKKELPGRLRYTVSCHNPEDFVSQPGRLRYTASCHNPEDFVSQPGILRVTTLVHSFGEKMGKRIHNTELSGGLRFTASIHKPDDLSLNN